MLMLKPWRNDMKIDADIALEVASHEAVIRQSYKDSVGKWTWSVGLTNATGHNVNRYIDNPQSLQRCLEVFLWALGDYADEVRAAFKGRELTKEQFTSALSFHWNTGSIKRASWVKSFLAGNMTAAKREFMNYSKPKEIIPRRRKERDLFFDGVWSNDGRMTEYTRLSKAHSPVWKSAKKVDAREAINSILREPAAKTVTPKIAAVVKDAAATDRVSKTNIAAGLGAASTAVATGKQIAETVTEAKSGIDMIVSAGPWVLLLCVGAGVGWYVWKERKRKRREAQEALR